MLTYDWTCHDVIEVDYGNRKKAHVETIQSLKLMQNECEVDILKRRPVGKIEFSSEIHTKEQIVEKALSTKNLFKSYTEDRNRGAN